MSSASMSCNFQARVLSSMDEETKLVQNQGILTILGSESVRNDATSSSLRLRRTLSADMSSKKWLSQNGFTPMKRIASSEDFSQFKIIPDSFSSSDEGDDNYEQENKRLESEDIWASIQRDKNKDREQPGQLDIWSSILSQKANEDSSKSLPPPYVHPLVKRSQSSLSEKSLEICTESLGSETGFDLLSSNPPSETGDAQEDEEEEHDQQKVTEESEEDNFEVPKYNYTANSKKLSPRSFPPPLPSLSRSDGPSLHMRSHRDDGRLVLEAVSVPSQNNFSAQRQDGRLVLTFANQEPKEEDSVQEMGEAEEDQMEDEFVGIEEGDETEEEEAGEIETMGDQTNMLSSGITRLTWMVNKPVELVNSNPNWSEKLNEVVKLDLISSASAIGSTASFNFYEYYWRTNRTPKSNPVAFHQQDHKTSSIVKNSNSGKFIVSGDMNQISKERQQLVVLRGKNGDYLVHNLKCCKEPRRSFLLWEPYCIATS